MTYEYERINFQDLSVSNPFTYKFVDNEDGTTTISEKFGDVVVEGTPINAENMNHLEDGIALTVDGLNELQGEINSLDIPTKTDLVVEDSQDVITSGGVFTALADLGSAVPTIEELEGTGTSNLSEDKYYRCEVLGAKEFVLPEVTDNTKFHRILVQISMETPESITVGTSHFFGKVSPDISEAGKYNIYYEFDGSNWVCEVRSKGTVPQSE